MPMIVTLKSYLEGLAEIESVKSSDMKQRVPSINELAKIVDVHQTTLNRIANNQTRKFDLDIADKIITEMRRRGFDMQVQDLVAYREA